MARKSINFYLVKTARLTGWLLLALMLLFMLTGFSLRGELGFGKLITTKTALKIHRIFEWPLIVVFLVHSMITIYFAPAWSTEIISLATSCIPTSPLTLISLFCFL